MVDNDHDYCPEKDWGAKPILSLSQLGILAILNSKDKALPVHKITAFLRRHFPFHLGTTTSLLNKVLKLNQNVVLRSSEAEAEEYHLPASKMQYCTRKYENMPCEYNSPLSPAYYMRFPSLWEQMVAGELEEEYEEDLDYLRMKQKTEETKTWRKPSIPERFLVALAILNSATGRLLASEIFAFIEKHFPYFRTADKKWKKQNANEALKAVRGMFGRDKLSKPETSDKLGNGSLNVYYIRKDRLNMFKEFFAKYTEENPDPKLYGMQDPDLWSAMVKGELKEEVDKARLKICSFGKVRSQMDKSDRNPYEATEEQKVENVVKPFLAFRLFALLGYLHLRQEAIFATQLYEWLKENFYYFRFANPSWRMQMKTVLNKTFIKKTAENVENLKGNEETTMYTLDYRKKRRLINEILVFEAKEKTVEAEKYGVASKEKWNRLFPTEFRKLFGPVTESDAESDDQEMFLVDEDYDLERDVGVKKKANESCADDKEGKVSRENETPPNDQESLTERRYGTRRKRIDFSKMVSNKLGEGEEETSEKKRRVR